MVIYDNKLWFRQILSFQRTDTLRVLLPELLIVAVYTAGVAYLESEYVENLEGLKSTISAHSLIGFVLGLLLVFRTNSAYDRWWEGRKHWGALVNNSRNLSIKLKSLVPFDKECQQFYQRMIPNFAFSLKEHLRDNRIMEELDLLPEESQVASKAEHLPNYISYKLHEKTVQLNKKGQVSNEDLMRLDDELGSLVNILGACERIKNTPIPFSYSIFLKKFVFIYIATLPIGFVPSFQYWTVPIVCFIFYVLVSLEILAEEIEDPFGLDDNDLPTQNLSDKIKANVKEIFEEL